MVAAIICLTMILSRGSAVGYWDEYAIADFLVRTHKAGWPSWSDLIAQHNESRKFFPRLAFWLTSLTGEWNPRHGMFLQWFMLVLSALALRKIMVRSMESRPAAWMSALGGSLLFSLAQWQNLLWGIQMITVVPTAALLGGLWWMGCERVGWWWRVAGCAGVSLIATYSYANGMAVWPLLAVGMMVLPQVGWRPRMTGIGAFVIIGAVAIGYYFAGYQKPAGHPPTDIALSHKSDAVAFVMAFLENGLRFTLDLDVAKWVGSAGLFIAATSLLGVMGRVGIERSTKALRQAAPWMLVTGYALLSGATTAVGRLGFGVHYGMSERYVTFAVPFWVGVLPLLWVSLQGLKGLRPDQRAAVTVFVGGALVGLWAASFPISNNGAKEHAENMRRAATLAKWSQVAPNGPEIVSRLYPDPNSFRRIVSDLESLGLLPYELNRKEFADEYVGNGEAEQVKHPLGSFDSVNPMGDKVRLDGWAVTPSSARRAADGIIITTQDPDGRQRILTVTVAKFDRPDVRLALGSTYPVRVGWSVELDRQIVVGRKLSAFVWDSKENRLYKLPTRIDSPL